LGGLTLVALIGLAWSGCSTLPREHDVIRADRAVAALRAAVDMELGRAADPNSPALANLVGSYAGEATGRQALVLVFDSPVATRQVTGGGSAGLPGAVTMRERNVVVFYEGLDAVRRRDTIADALRSAAAGN
jgi:hypothetical protein